MSVDEKIRRAEEIYNRRNSGDYYSSHITCTKKYSFKRRLFKQILICLCVYCVFYVTSNREYFLSEEFRKNAEDFSKKNVFLNNTYNYVMGYIDKYLNKNNSTEPTPKDDSQKDTNSQIEENITGDIKENEENIGGASEDVETVIQKTQEELDVDYIKNKFSFIIPVEGTISSTFGWRNPTTSTVPKYHTGLDLAAPIGTIIKSAIDGTVTQVSSSGDYGKHYRIQNDDITIIYAHCSKLYLNEGDYVIQGQEIGEVGSTGNSTRSTFTF